MWVSVTSVWSAVRSAVRGRSSKATNAEVRGKIRGQVPRPSFVMTVLIRTVGSWEQKKV